MKIQQIVIAIVLLFTVSIAHAQYYYYTPPPGYAPPPGYGAPPGPPPGYGPPTAFWPWPPDTGPYFRASMGPAFYQNSNLKGYTFPPAFGNAGYVGPSGSVHYDVGLSADFGFGWAFDRYVSLGFQTGYTWAQMDSVDNYVVNNSSMGNVPFLANLTLSLPVDHSNIIPYIGGGVGGSDSIFDAHTFFPQSATGAAETVFGSEADVVFAWQASAGVRFKITPNISLGVGYEYFATGNPTFSFPPAPNLNATFQGVRTHSVLFVFQANF